MILGFFIIFTAFCTGPSTDLVAFLQICGVALVLCAAICAFSSFLLGYGIKEELLLYRLLPLFIAYGAVLVVEVIKANIAVMKRIFKKEDPKGCVVSFRSGMKSGLARMLLANAITLTPGTITVHTEGDLYTVHCLSASFGEGIENFPLIKVTQKIDRVISSAKRTPKRKKNQKK